MHQYKINYITHNDRKDTVYIFANSDKEAEHSASILQGCKHILEIMRID